MEKTSVGGINLPNPSKKPSCLIAGGDLRQIYLANLLAGEMAVSVTALGRDHSQLSSQVRHGIPPAPDYLILPLPASSGALLNAPLEGSPVPLEQILSCAAGHTLVFGGRIGPELWEALRRRGLTGFDYLEREELAVLNAAATAEGALALLLDELPITLSGARILVVGSGRISRALRSRLLALGSEVTVSARRPAELAWIQAEGGRPLPSAELGGALAGFDAVVNTVPARLFGEEMLRRLGRETLLIDLASRPGGVDFEAAARLGVRAVWALSLPGKTAPVTAGRIIGQTIRNIIKEEEHGKA